MFKSRVPLQCSRTCPRAEYDYNAQEPSRQIMGPRAEYDYNAQEPPRQIMVVAKRNLSNLGSATEVCHCMYSMSVDIVVTKPTPQHKRFSVPQHQGRI